jgi:hypothetical protein
VVQWARESGVDAVLGNHDAHVLRARHGEIVAKPKHQKIADDLSRADVAWLDARPLFLRIGDVVAGHAKPRPYAVVHGGAVPGVALEEQERDHLLNLRSIADDGRPSKQIEGAPWGARWSGPEHIVFGHDAVRGLQQHAATTGLDTGCVYGRELTALILPAGRLVSVPARHAYAPMK